jgi:hypothetical protein
VLKELTVEDKRRIQKCSNYKAAKNILHTHRSHAELKLGEVYLIKYKRRSSDEHYTYVSRGYGVEKPDKYFVFHIDEEGFVFVKRINSDGRLGKEIRCLTTEFAQPKYQIEPDPEYVEHIIFQTEEDYDPAREEKELKKKKTRARKENQPKRAEFDTAAEAHAYLKTLKVGDKIYDCKASHGEGVMEWTVTKIETRPVDKTQKADWNNNIYYGNTPHDRKHNQHNLTEFVMLDIVCNHDRPKVRRWVGTNRRVIFDSFLKRKGKRYGIYYHTMPTTVEDV